MLAFCLGSCRSAPAELGKSGAPDTNAEQQRSEISNQALWDGFLKLLAAHGGRTNRADFEKAFRIRMRSDLDPQRPNRARNGTEDNAPRRFAYDWKNAWAFLDENGPSGALDIPGKRQFDTSLNIVFKDGLIAPCVGRDAAIHDLTNIGWIRTTSYQPPAYKLPDAFSRNRHDPINSIIQAVLASEETFQAKTGLIKMSAPKTDRPDVECVNHVELGYFGAQKGELRK